MTADQAPGTCRDCGHLHSKWARATQDPTCAHQVGTDDQGLPVRCWCTSRDWQPGEVFA